MIVYIPQRIETAEQAEALPDNTMVIHPQEWPLVFVSGKLYTESETVTVKEIVEQGGYSALVPIEAEEERVQRIQYDRRGYESAVYSETRLATPWEPVSGPSPDRRGDCA